MVRSVSGFNSSNVNGLMLSSKNKVNNIVKHIDLPKKIALSSLGTFYTTKTIGDAGIRDAFVMKCSDYENSDTCSSDYWCGLTFP